MIRRAVTLGVGLFLLGGCKKDEVDVPAPGEDRALEILRREVERENRGEAIARAPNAPDDPNAHLAELAINKAAPRDLALPENNAPIQLGPLSVQLAGVRATHTVTAGKLDLTSEDMFLFVAIAAQNTGTEAGRFDLSLAKIVDRGEHVYAPASDVQRTAGTRELSHELQPGDEAKLTLVFEVPPAVVGKGLTLLLPAGISPSAEGDVRIPLDSPN